MRERAAAVRVSERPDSPHVRAAFVVDLDESAWVGLDARLVEAKIVRVRDAPDREEYVGSDGDRLPAAAVQSDRDPVGALLEADALGVGADLDALALEDRADLGRDVVVLARQKLRCALYNGDFRAETPVHLREFEPDVAAADDHEVLGQEIHVHDRLVREVWNIVNARHIRHEGATADVDEDFVRGERTPVDGDGARPGETRVPADERHIAHVREPLLETVRRVADDLVLARLHRAHVDAHFSRREAVFAAAARDVRGARARHQRLRRDTAVVHARAAEVAPFDYRGLELLAVEPRGECRARLAGPDDDGVELLVHGTV